MQLNEKLGDGCNAKVTRKNLRLRLGDIVTVHEAPDVKYATVVHVLPYAEDLEGVTGETFETFLQPFFEGEFKPVRHFFIPLWTENTRIA